ncbi:MAG: BamA/TamA family outer membrane protein [Ferruginibacter sp.]
MKKIFKIIYTLGIMIAPAYCIAQSSQTKTIKIAANEQYNKASKFKRLMLGEHFRKDWATPVDIEILDMDKEAGGLKPIKLGGGQQTKSLRLKGANGKEYVLRSVNKDPSKAIAQELRGTFAEDIVQDQISSSNPYAPLVVASLAEKAGIFNNRPRLVYIPQSAALGEYAKVFEGTICLFEERPSGDGQNTIAYGGANKIVNTQKLLERVFSNSDHQVDEKSFAKARMFDILIGDWDRHEDQWQWAAFETGDKTIYKPIPRDRDQAFSKLDGVIPRMVTRPWALRKVQSFNGHIDDVVGLATSGVHLDRNFTTRLVLADWISVTSELQHALTDAVIDSACLLFPKEIYKLSGKQIASKLKQRRDDLQLYAKRYYSFLSKEVNIVGTKNKEAFEVKRINDDSVNVIMYAIGKNDKQDKIIYNRTFLVNETNEIRLYGLDRDDRFSIEGRSTKSITVRVIGGDGKDTYNDASVVEQPGKHTKIYDNRSNVFNTNSETRKYISSDSLKNKYYRRSYRYNWFSPVPRYGFNPDDGIYLGGAIVFKKQGFGVQPYSFLQTIGGAYAFKTGAYNFWYKGIFKEVIGKWDLNLDAAVNAPNYSRNYYGLGNDSKKSNDDKNYYRAHFNEEVTSASLKRQFGKKHAFEFGLGFQAVKLEEKDGRFISSTDSKLDSSDFERNYNMDIKLQYEFNTTNNNFYPTKGIKFLSGVKFTQSLDEKEQNFIRLFYEASLYTTKGRFTLANHSGLSTNIGDDYEFYQANTLSGLTNLRGYRRDRFAGKTSFFTNSELRFRAGNAKGYILRGAWGLLAFADNGRVCMPEEDSKTWHHGYGGGLWFLPFNKVALTASYGVSKEDNIFNIKAGFQF